MLAAFHRLFKVGWLAAYGAHDVPHVLLLHIIHVHTKIDREPFAPFMHVVVFLLQLGKNFR